MQELQRKRIKIKNKRRKRNKIIIGFFVIFLIISCIIISIINKSSYVIFLDKMDMGKYKISDLKKNRKEYEDSLKILAIDLKWENNFETGNNPKYLVFHHTASNSNSVESINKMHVENGWGGIGYHYYIRKDGTIYKGRPEESVGAHAIGKNRESIGICLEGNFENTKPTEAQLTSLIKLSSDMIIKYNIEGTLGHRDVYSTLCPGKNFSVEQVNKGIAEELIKITEKDK